MNRRNARRGGVRQSIAACLLGVGLFGSSVGLADVVIANRCSRDEAFDACRAFLDGESAVGICMPTGKCEPNVPIASIQSSIEGTRRSGWRAVGVLVGVALLGIVMGRIDNKIRRIAEKRSKEYEIELPPISKWRIIARWGLPLVLCVIVVYWKQEWFVDRLKRISSYSEYTLTNAEQSPLSLEWYFYPPYVVEKDGQSRVIVKSEISGKRELGELVVAYDISSQKPVWSRAAKQWLDAPMALVTYSGKTVVITGSGVVEIREPISGNLLHSGQMDYRVRRISPVPDQDALWVWDWQSMYGRIDLNTGHYSTDYAAKYYGARRTQNECNLMDSHKLKAAKHGYWHQVCRYQNSLIGIGTESKENKVYLSLVNEESGETVWERVVAIPLDSHGLFDSGRMSLNGDLVLLRETHADGDGLEAVDVLTGKTRWTIKPKYRWSTEGILHDSEHILVMVENPADGRPAGTNRHWLQVYKKGTGDMVGTIPADAPK